jgi:hypothetical protein
MTKISTPRIHAVEFEVDDIMLVADPCYIDNGDGETSEAVVTHVIDSNLGRAISGAKGKWIAQIDLVDEGSWGLRVASLQAIRVGVTPVGPKEHIGVNGVDSGQMYMGCASNAPLDYERILGAYSDDWNEKILAVEGGVVSSTGYGDGVYDVYTRADRNGVVAEVTVEFIGENDDDEDEGW